jgi:hypothetical protein
MLLSLGVGSTRQHPGSVSSNANHYTSLSPTKFDIQRFSFHPQGNVDRIQPGHADNRRDNDGQSAMGKAVFSLGISSLSDTGFYHSNCFISFLFFSFATLPGIDIL